MGTFLSTRSLHNCFFWLLMETISQVKLSLIFWVFVVFRYPPAPPSSMLMTLLVVHGGCSNGINFARRRTGFRSTLNLGAGGVKTLQVTYVSWWMYLRTNPLCLHLRKWFHHLSVYHVACFNLSSPPPVVSYFVVSVSSLTGRRCRGRLQGRVDVEAQIVTLPLPQSEKSGIRPLLFTRILFGDSKW